MNDIVCFEERSSEDWSAPTGISPADLDAVKRLEQQNIVLVTVAGDKYCVRGLDRIGIILLPSGRRLVIRSKIKNITILEWLAYIGTFPDLQAWIKDYGIKAEDEFVECLGRLFVSELDKVSRIHLRKDFTKVTSENTFVRGRIIADRFYRVFHRLPRIPQTYRERTLNTKANIVLAIALDKVSYLLKGASSVWTAQYFQLKDAWSSIDRQLMDIRMAVNEVQISAPPGYRFALQLAKVLLLGAGIDRLSPLGGQIFTLPMASLWEESVRRMCCEVGLSSGWSQVPDAEHTRQWDDPAGADDPNRWMTADVILQKLHRRWVFDAKYKRTFTNESRGDRFQMCAYVLGFGAGRATLVYPTDEEPGQRRLLTLVPHPLD